jgi:putative nucleotide binding protein
LEDYAYILDYMPQGSPAERSFRHEPTCFAIGSEEFKLFELVPRQGVVTSPGDKVYIGKEMDKREHIVHVKRRLSFEELTSNGQSELPHTLELIVLDNEPRFVRFFNEAQPITTRLHTLELLPGLGKKSMWSIIEERKKEKFKDLADLQHRVPTVHGPAKIIAKRITDELSDHEQKYRIFVAR